MFLYEASTATSIEEILKDLVEIFNLRLKIKRILMEVECLADHGIFKPPEMLGRVTRFGHFVLYKIYQIWSLSMVRTPGRANQRVKTCG